jgi:3-oxoacyl-(acyl-carrier-protein) synthase
VVVSEIFIAGTGAVSPAGWGVPSFCEAISRGEPPPIQSLARPGFDEPLQARQVPRPAPRPAFMAHARLRRASPIAHHAVGAGLEALGEHAAKYANGVARLGIIFCAMSGCVNYSRRFYDEVLKDPATASPLVFPETVYNSPASHLAALLGTTAINYTLVGDPGTFIQGLVLAADWLANNRVDGCLVVGAEEMDWLTADAMRLFDRKTILSDGAGAIFLTRESIDNSVRLDAVSDSQLFHDRKSRAEAARHVRAQMNSDEETDLLCDSLTGAIAADREEQNAWRDWRGKRISVKPVFGEGFMAGAAWQCIAAVEALRAGRNPAAIVNVVGCNEQAIAARFTALK